MPAWYSVDFDLGCELEGRTRIQALAPLTKSAKNTTVCKYRACLSTLTRRSLIEIGCCSVPMKRD